MEGLSLYWTPAEAAAARRAAADSGVDTVGAWLDTGDVSAAGGSGGADAARCMVPPEDAVLPWLDCELRLTVVMGGGGQSRGSCTARDSSLHSSTSCTSAAVNHCRNADPNLSKGASVAPG